MGRSVADDAAGIDDVLLESAVTTIMDCEDSVAAVDGEDKVLVYRNWLGLMKRDLTAPSRKAARRSSAGSTKTAAIPHPTAPNRVLPGRSTMLVRNVSDILKCGAVLDAKGDPVPEGILDAVITSLIAKHDLKAREGRQQPDRLGLYREAEDAWTGRSRRRRGAVRRY